MSERKFNWLRAPLWPFEIFTAKKDFKNNPLLSSAKLNRKGLHVFRVKLAYRMVEWRRARIAKLVSAEDREAFNKQGYVAKPGFVKPDDFPALRAEITALQGNAIEFIEGSTITRRFAITPDVLARNPALRRLVEDETFQGLMRYVSSFDAPPFLFVQTILTHVNDTVQDPQNAMHTDAFHPSMKAWLFMDDVKIEDGPFTYIPGSHKLTKRRLAWHKRRSIRASQPGGPKGGAFRFTETDQRILHLPAPQHFTVPANTLVVGDTFGLHCRHPSAGPVMRVEIWAYSRPNPFTPFTKPLWRMIPLAGWMVERAFPLILSKLERLPGQRFRRRIVHGISPTTPPEAVKRPD